MRTLFTLEVRVWIPGGGNHGAIFAPWSLSTGFLFPVNGSTTSSVVQAPNGGDFLDFPPSVILSTGPPIWPQMTR